MVRLISRQRGGLAALKLTKLFGIDDFPAAKDSGKVRIIIIYCYLIIIIIIIIIIIQWQLVITVFADFFIHSYWMTYWRHSPAFVRNSITIFATFIAAT